MCEVNVSLKGKVAIVTGGSSGIGYETAKELAGHGASVIIASRNETKLKAAKASIQEATGNPNVTYNVLDLASLKSVRNFANEMLIKNRLDVLINNAGAVALPDRLTADDLNLTMQVNYFGTFLLTYLLLPLLKSSAPSRIINVSAASMYLGEIDFDHWNDVGTYSTIQSLANSKLAMTLFTAELDRRLKGKYVTANSFDPFVVRDTDILVNFNDAFKDISNIFINLIGQRKEDVGKEIAYFAASPELNGVSGNHYKFCDKWLNHWSVGNEQLTKEIWERSKVLVKVTEDEKWD